ncbi:hypothetical protein SeMB42_g04074 [Synchytrium endobioticum]|uniref:TLC domain-containing protein n=1 Tax=Synchytrium endobioticum TaxID=286115 RepID=A0A507D1Z2_9FUNG|nr:hypothetical protein SeMB42_g04074 [Synchytrium endobioticum]TPX46211.1 hypothetical protein SeLEV6574_g03345 [Synchytrium endobioticum]
MTGTTFFDQIGLPLLNTHGYTVLKSLGVWQCLYILSHPISSYMSSTYKKITPTKQAEWCSRLVSTAHALVVCYLSIPLLSDPVLSRDKVFAFTEGASHTASVTIGYFLWDTIVSLYSVETAGPSFLFHALISLIAFLLTMQPFLMYFIGPFLLFEISTPLLNINWFCDKLNMTGSTLQLINGILLILSFFCVRMIYGLYLNYDMFYSFYLQRDKISPYVIVIYGACNVSETILNFFWFYKIIDAIRRRFIKRTPPSRKQDVVQHSNGMPDHQFEKEE